jgi:dihydrofolate reductase
VVSSLDEALKSAVGFDEVFVIGGAEIYQLALSRVQRLYLTLVEAEMDGDAFFPEFLESEFVEVSREDREGLLPYRYVVLDRK